MENWLDIRVLQIHIKCQFTESDRVFDEKKKYFELLFGMAMLQVCDHHAHQVKMKDSFFINKYNNESEKIFNSNQYSFGIAVHFSLVPDDHNNLQHLNSLIRHDPTKLEKYEI